MHPVRRHLHLIYLRSLLARWCTNVLAIRQTCRLLTHHRSVYDLMRHLVVGSIVAVPVLAWDERLDVLAPTWALSHHWS